MKKRKLVGFLGSCTEVCGGVHGYFCVRCRHYLVDCRCTPAHCECGDSQGWASQGERKVIRAALEAEA